MTGVDDGGCALAGALWWRALGGGANTVPARQLEAQANEAKAARADFDPGQREGKHPSVYARHPRATLPKLSAVRTPLAGIVPYTPRGQRGARPREGWGGWTLSDALRAPLPVLLAEGGAFASIPTGLPWRGAVWWLVDDGCHRALLGVSLAW